MTGRVKIGQARRIHREPAARGRAVRWLEDVTLDDVVSVGGKNASLGELTRGLGDHGVVVPPGFALTADAYWAFVDAARLRPAMRELIADLQAGRRNLDEVGATIRARVIGSAVPEGLAAEVRAAYRELSRRCSADDVAVAVRSSATAEDLPEASFAGQHETFLNVVGEDDVVDACRRCFASLFTNRAISYRERLGIDHMRVALSVGVQQMVRSDLASSGVMFTIDTETGFPHLVVINASWGLGESVVQGIVNPDEYRVFKPLLNVPDVIPIIDRRPGAKETKTVYDPAGGTVQVETAPEDRAALVLTDDETLTLARVGTAIEAHYGKPMDVEWAKDGEDGRLYVVQARPETVESRKVAAQLREFRLTATGPIAAEGVAVGDAIAAGTAFVMLTLDEATRFQNGGILVTDMTDPDWVPVMRRAAGIVTDLGGRTSHAAIVSRELGVPAIVGCGKATSAIRSGQEITVCCAEGEIGRVYRGRLGFEVTDVDLEELPGTRTRILVNLGDPDSAFRWWRLPADGVGLARMEFVINDVIKIHPMALLRLDQIDDSEVRRTIERLTRGFADRTEYFVDHLARGIAKIAASRWPDPVIVRTSDFKTNEYANLVGGRWFEPAEENPMLGLRGASRYYSDRYRDAFALECQALRRAREEMGFRNVVVMIPFCRTLEEADRVLNIMADHGLRRGEAGLEVYVMCEIPSNVLLASGFAARFDGFSIGSNDLTQLVLGVDRDSAELAPLFDERNEAVKEMIRGLIPAAHAAGRTVGICGQAPSDYPDFAEFLVREGIDSMSLNPDSVIAVRRLVAALEATIRPVPRRTLGSAGGSMSHV
jgi:pyruvate,water dikinase